MSYEQERYAPSGMIFVCGACGKVAEDRYGIVGFRSRGWDVSCMMNCDLYDRESLVWNEENTRVIEIRADDGASLREQGPRPQDASPPDPMGQSPGGQGSDATSDPAPRQEEIE